MSSAILTVSQLNRYVKARLEEDGRLQSLFVRGEISNLVDHYQSGHLYFTLKEGGCAVKAVMFASYARQLRFQPENGLAVILRGAVSLYERDGSYQVYVYEMIPEGKGDLQLAFEQRYRKLEREGLFDPARKRPLPSCPERIGIVTSETGAVLQDIRSVIGRRFPGVRLILWPALVQGEGAAASICQGIRQFNLQKACDLLIVGRGGGSMEDLWCFNEEEVVRAVTASAIPVISAVGHETDFTLCDYAADLRAPTPSAAAELAVPDARELRMDLAGMEGCIRRGMEGILRTRMEQFSELLASPPFVDCGHIMAPLRKNLEYFTNTIRNTAKHDIMKRKERLAAQGATLHALDPLARLHSGYTVTFGEDGKTLRQAEQVAQGELIQTRFWDGVVLSRVEAVKPFPKES